MRISTLECACALAACATLSLQGATCESLASLKISDATVITATSLPAGPFATPDGRKVEVNTPFCRVSIALQPSPDSDIPVEVWMPASGWNGKFQGVGNGGYAGSIGFPELAYAVSHGYTAAATDTGHRGKATEAQWALNHPEKIVDFAYRAIHETAETAKAVIKTFYGEGPKHSYFNSCSTGGRQGLMEAQRYPADYDGIVAGAPANYWTHGLIACISNTRALSEPGAFVPPSKLRTIETAALAACDSNDGVKDGVIENPMQCHFDPSVLLCKGPDSDSCLTAPQVTALKKIYAGTIDSRGKLLMPGFSPGGEAEPGGWGAWITGAAFEASLEHAYGTNFFRFMVFEDPNWDYKTSSEEHNAKVADDKLARTLNAMDPDLSKFRARGGKLILFHGWADAAIPPANTVNYYAAVQKKLGAKEAAEFVRLFMVPGMQHCAGGTAPDYFGQNTVPRNDADHDIDAAVERWVEQGAAPEKIIAAKLKERVNPAAGISRTRPLCAWPKTAHYNGSGSTDEAESFECK
jgi:Tannase and feruloyl esterase